LSEIEKDILRNNCQSQYVDPSTSKLAGDPFQVVRNTHSDELTSIDWSPNQHYPMIATSSDDCTINVLT